ncbi:MAG: triose-phosphate isomerase [Thermoleophilaceae bacterium]|nr:triose-phosphate isomerase [Thermoleophilaceae bacterium]
MPSRTPYVAGNWKMWGTQSQARELVTALADAMPDPAQVQTAVCVPFTALVSAVEAAEGSNLAVLAQNMHQAETGAFTGEVSAGMLLDVGADGVVLGHSERRQYFGETDRALQEKVRAALGAGLCPILCVGETEEENDAGETQRKLRQQVNDALNGPDPSRLGDIIIAYEPIWAIGTGRTATPGEAQDACAFVRALVGDRSSAVADGLRVLYGGSVKPDNAAELMAQPDIDGALVGGASLAAESFLAIVEAARAA